MKKQNPKTSAKHKTKRPAPVGEVKTAHRPARSKTDKPEAAHRARPAFVSEAEAAEMANFEPSPQMFACACAFIWDEARSAYANGDNDLLSRAGIADALDYLTMPDNAGRDAAAFAEMLEDWRDAQEKRNRQAEAARKVSAVEKVLRRVMFWGWFDETKTPDEMARLMRGLFLRTRPRLGETLREWKRVYYETPATRDIEFFDKITDTFFEGEIDTEKPEPARVRADWLNDCFFMAGEDLAKWLQIAALPDYAATVADLRKQIANNYGIFPAPFDVGELAGVKMPVLTSDILEKLRYIARDLSRRKSAGTLQESPAENVAGGKPDAGGRVAGKWAIAHGVKGYNGGRFEFGGEIITRDEKQGKRWGVFAAVIESAEADGAAFLGNWRGVFSGAEGVYKYFSRYIHPVQERGAGWYRIEKKKIKERRGW